jgi:hypothetical protein
MENKETNNKKEGEEGGFETKMERNESGNFSINKKGIVSLFLTSLLILAFISGSVSAAITIIGDMAPPSGEYYVFLYNETQNNNPCDGVVGGGDTGALIAQNNTATLGMGWNNDYTDNIDYGLVNDSYTFNGELAYLYWCKGALGSDLLAWKAINLSGVTMTEVDLAAVTSVGTMAGALTGFYAVICDDLDGTKLSTQGVGPTASNSYAQYYILDRNISPPTFNDTYILLTFDDRCDFNSSVNATKEINLTLSADNYGVYVDFAPDWEVKGDLHKDISPNNRIDFYDRNGKSIGIVESIFSSPDGLDDGNDDYRTYIDKPTGLVGNLTIVISKTTITEEFVKFVSNSTQALDFVVKINGTVPDEINHVNITDSLGVLYYTDPNASGYYSLYVPDNNSGNTWQGNITTQNLLFSTQTFGLVYTDSSINVGNMTVGSGGEEDEIVDVAKLWGYINSGFITSASSTGTSCNMVEVWNDYTNPTNKNNTACFVYNSSGADNYTVYFGVTDATGTNSYDVKFNNSNSQVTWFNDLTDNATYWGVYFTGVLTGNANNNVINPGDELQFNLNFTVTGEVPNDVNYTHLVDNASAPTILESAVVNGSGDYLMYVSPNMTTTGALYYMLETKGDNWDTNVLYRDSGKGNNFSTSGDTFYAAKLNGTIWNGFFDGNYNIGSTTVDVWNDLTNPTTQYNSESNFTNSSSLDTYWVYFELPTSGGLSSVDVHFNSTANNSAWLDDLTDNQTWWGVSTLSPHGEAYNNTIDPSEILTLDLNYTITGDVPTDVDLVSVLDSNDNDTFMSAVPNADGTYFMFISGNWTAAGEMFFALNRSGFGDFCLYRNSTNGSSFTGNETFNAMKIQGVIDESLLTDASRRLSGVDVCNDYTAGTPTCYNSISNVTNASGPSGNDSYEVYFEDPTPLDTVDVKFTNTGGEISWVNNFTDAYGFGVYNYTNDGGTPNNSALDPGEMYEFNLTYTMSCIVPFDVSFITLKDNNATGPIYGAAVPLGSGSYTMYVSGVWNASWNETYQLDGGVWEARLEKPSGTVVLNWTLGYSVFTSDETLFCAGKINGTVPGNDTSTTYLRNGEVRAYQSAGQYCGAGYNSTGTITNTGTGKETYEIYLMNDSSYYLDFCDSAGDTEYETLIAKSVSAGENGTLNLSMVTGKMDDDFAVGGNAIITVWDDFLSNEVGGQNRTDNNGTNITATETAGDYEVYFEHSGSKAALSIITDEAGRTESGTFLDVALKIADNDSYVSWEIGVEGSDINAGDVVTADLVINVSGRVPTDVTYVVIENSSDELAIGIPKADGTYRIHTQNWTSVNVVLENSTYDVLSRNQTDLEDMVFDAAKVTGETHDNLETGDDYLRIYSDSGCTVMVSSIMKYPSNSSGIDYEIYYEHTGGNTYYVNATMNVSSIEYSSCGNEITGVLPGNASSLNITVEKTGNATSDITKVGIDLDNGGSDNVTTTDFNSGEYHIFTVPDDEATSWINYYTGSYTKVFYITEDFSSTDHTVPKTLSNNISKINGTVPDDIQTVELETSPGQACGGSNYTINKTFGSNPKEYLLYYKANGTIYYILYCNGTEKELEWNFTSDLDGGKTVTIDVAKLNGTINNLFVNVDVSNLIEVYDKKGGTKISSTSDTLEWIYDYVRDTGDGSIDTSEMAVGDDANNNTLYSFAYWQPSIGYTISQIRIYINESVGSPDTKISVRFGTVNNADDHSLNSALAKCVNITVANNTWAVCNLNNTVTVNAGTWYAAQLMYDPNDDGIPENYSADSTADYWKIWVDSSNTNYNNFDYYNGSQWRNDSIPAIRFENTSSDDTYEVHFVESNTNGTPTNVDTIDVRFTDNDSSESWRLNISNSGAAIVGGDTINIDFTNRINGTVHTDISDVFLAERGGISGVTFIRNLTQAIIATSGVFAMYVDTVAVGTGNNWFYDAKNASNYLLLKRNQTVTSTGNLDGDTFYVNRVNGTLHSDLQNTAANDVVKVYTDFGCWNETSSEDLIISADSIYRQYYEVDGASHIYLKVVENNSVNDYESCVNTTIAIPTPWSNSQFNLNIRVNGSVAPDLTNVYVDTNNDGVNEINGTIVTATTPDTYKLYFNGSGTANILFYNSSNLELNRTGKNFLSNTAINVSRVVGETLSNLEGAGSNIQVYGDQYCLTTLLSSESERPTDSSGYDYVQYFEGSAGPYYIKANATIGGYNYTTCGIGGFYVNGTNENRTDFDTQISGVVPNISSSLTTQHIISVGVDISNNGSDNFLTRPLNTNPSYSNYYLFADNRTAPSSVHNVTFYNGTTITTKVLYKKAVTLSNVSINVSVVFGEANAFLENLSDTIKVCTSMPTLGSGWGTDGTYESVTCPGQVSNITEIPANNKYGTNDYEIFFEQLNSCSYTLQIGDNESTVWYYSFNNFTSCPGGGNETSYNLTGRKWGNVTKEYDSTIPLGNVTVTVYEAGTTTFDARTYTLYNPTTGVTGEYKVYVGNANATLKKVVYSKNGFITTTLDNENITDGSGTQNNVSLNSSVKIIVKEFNTDNVITDAIITLYMCSGDNVTTCNTTIIPNCYNPLGNCRRVGNGSLGNGNNGEYYFDGMDNGTYIQIKIERAYYDSIVDPDPINDANPTYQTSDTMVQPTGLTTQYTYYLQNPAPECTLTARIQNNKQYARTGDLVNFTMSCNNETGLNVTLDASSLNSSDGSAIMTDSGSTGEYTYTVRINETNDGVKTIRANASDGVNVVTRTVTVTLDNTAPTVGTPQLSDNTVAPGDDITVTATVSDTTSGVEDDELCTVTVGGVSAGIIRYNSSTGNCSGTIEIPSLADGSQTLIVSVADRAENTGSNNVTITIMTASITVSPTFGAYGTIVNITGSGFGANENVTIDFGSTSNILITSSNASGNISAQFTVDVQPAGAKNVTATGLTSGKVAQVAFIINGTAAITVTPTTGPTGTTAHIFGKGFGANESVTIRVPAATSPIYEITDSAGAFHITFVASSSGSVNATGATTGEYAAGTFTITTGTLSVSPTFGAYGTQVTVTGANFQANENIRVDFGSTPNIVNGTANNSGGFVLTFNVDVQPAGLKEVYAEGLTSGQKAAATFTINKTANITLTPSAGVTGTTVHIYGFGFGANEQVTITVPSSPSNGQMQLELSQQPS